MPLFATLLLTLLGGAAPAVTDLHQPFDELLAAHVAGGVVDYAGLAEDAAALEAYLESLAATDPSSLDRNGQVALWVNAYNAFTIRLILDHYPGLESIKDIPGSERWTQQRWVVGGRTYSLDQIEHEILRPMGDARVHFVLVCASKSCPGLFEALHADSVDEQLTAAAQRFLSNRQKGLSAGVEQGVLWGENNVLRLSKIFSWFDEDFGDDEGQLIDFVVRYAPAEAVRFISAHRGDLDLEYFDYDWSLNGR